MQTLKGTIGFTYRHARSKSRQVGQRSTTTRSVYDRRYLRMFPFGSAKTANDLSTTDNPVGYDLMRGVSFQTRLFIFVLAFVFDGARCTAQSNRRSMGTHCLDRSSGRAVWNNRDIAGFGWIPISGFTGWIDSLRWRVL